MSEQPSQPNTSPVSPAPAKKELHKQWWFWVIGAALLASFYIWDRIEKPLSVHAVIETYKPNNTFGLYGRRMVRVRGVVNRTASPARLEDESGFKDVSGLTESIALPNIASDVKDRDIVVFKGIFWPKERLLKSGYYDIQGHASSR